MQRLAILGIISLASLAGCGSEAHDPGETGEENTDMGEDPSPSENTETGEDPSPSLEPAPSLEPSPSFEVGERDANWSDSTHSNDTEPDYDTVFATDEVLRLDITIDAAQWQAMQDDLSENLTTAGGGRGGRGGGGTTELQFDPIWGEATIAFNGETWEHVGIRYKGNSTLRGAANSNSDKFPFKLDFDEWEATYPQIDDQRFYGFKQLNLGTNYNDASFMRERVATDLFREFGVPAAHVSFCEVYIDRGEGLNFVGLYSLVEEADDTLIRTQFEYTDGNLYKPEDEGATFALSSYNESDMYLKTNQENANYDDVETFNEVLHSAARTSDPAAWTQELESIFYVDGFLRYLAVNQVIQNWDTYGMMTHNYFLYNNEGLLTWVPWDYNESLRDGNRGGALSLGLAEVGEDWPILRYIMDVPEYEETYRSYVQEFAEDYFTEEKMTAIFATHAAVIADVAAEETAQFDAAVQALNTHVATRQAAVDDFL